MQLHTAVVLDSGYGPHYLQRQLVLWLFRTLKNLSSAHRHGQGGSCEGQLPSSCWDSCSTTSLILLISDHISVSFLFPWGSFAPQDPVTPLRCLTSVCYLSPHRDQLSNRSYWKEESFLPAQLWGISVSVCHDGEGTVVRISLSVVLSESVR